MQKCLASLGVIGLALLTIMALFASVADAQSATPMTMATPGANMATVRVVHASPDAPAVDVYVDGAKAVTDLAFGKATDFVALPAGKHEFQVVPTGEPMAKAVIDVKGADLQAGHAYDVAAVGLVKNIKAEIYPVDLSPIESGKARVRVVHASPDAPAVDVAVKGGPVLFSNIMFPNASAYAPVAAGTYDLEVRPAGKTEVVLPLNGVKLEAGMVYDVFAIGQVSNKTLGVLVLTAPAMMSRMGTPTS